MIPQYSSQTETQMIEEISKLIYFNKRSYEYRNNNIQHSIVCDHITQLETIM